MQQTGEFQSAKPAVEKKGSSKGLVLAVVFLALCSLVLGGLYCYEKFIAKSDDSAIANTSPEEKRDVKADEVEKIDGAAKEEILGVATVDEDLKVRELINAVEKAWIKETRSYSGHKYYGESGPMVKLESGNWVEASKFYGFITGGDWTNVGRDPIVKVLAENGLVRDKDYYVNSQTEQFYYVNDSIVCHLYDVMTNATEYHLVCANKDWVSDSDEALADALIKTYNDKANTNAKINYMYNAKVDRIVTKDNGYQTIEASVIDAAALFYRKDKDSDWKFFAETQGDLNCSEYNTEELREAYKGESCYDGTSRSEVK